MGKSSRSGDGWLDSNQALQPTNRDNQRNQGCIPDEAFSRATDELVISLIRIRDFHFYSSPLCSEGPAHLCVSVDAELQTNIK